LRLVRQLLAENLVLALAGGALATFAAWWSTRLLFPASLRRAWLLCPP
jgi:hypothetical protein